MHGGERGRGRGAGRKRRAAGGRGGGSEPEGRGGGRPGNEAWGGNTEAGRGTRQGHFGMKEAMEITEHAREKEAEIS